MPSIYDGCKLVERRVLWAAYSKAPASKEVKLTSMSGYVIQVHPHAEATETIVKMGGPYNTSFPLFDTDGDWGDQNGNPHAAPRYLECRLNDKARKMFFSLISEAPMENFEVEEEPLYLPTLFPLALLQGCFSVGQGTPNPLIPELNFEDLKKYIINYIKTGEKKVTKQNFVRTTDYEQIRNDNMKDTSICDLLNRGKGTIYYQPKVEIQGNSIIISNLYVLAQFSSLVDRFKDDIHADKIDIRDESDTEKVWVIEKVKNKVFDLEECAKIVRSKFTYKENYAMYFHDENGNVKPYSLGDIIEACYNKYSEAYQNKLNHEIDALCEQKTILECLAAMSEHTDIVIDNKISDEDKIKQIEKAINNKNNFFNKYTIEKALQKPISWLKNDVKAIDAITKKITDRQKDVNNLSDTILSDLSKI